MSSLFSLLLIYLFVGKTCADDIDECALYPCHNGNCINTKPGYKCACDSGYSGINCDVDIDECQSSLCL